MKLNLNQLAAHLNKQLMPFYFISGDEILLVDEARQSIKKTAQNAGFSGSEYYQVDDAFDFERLQQEAQQVSLFSEKSIIELRFPNHKFSDAAKKFFQTIIETPLPDKILLVVSDKLESSQLKTKWLQSVESAAVFMQIWPIERTQLPQWIKLRGQQLDLIIAPQACDLLADFTEGNLLACAQTIEQLKLLHGQGAVSLEQVEQAVADNARFDIFALVDSVIAGETQRALRILQNLQQEGVEAILILWALARECRILLELSWQLAKKQSLESSLQKAKIWPKRQALIKKALQRKSYEHWRLYLTQMQKIDRQLKGAEKGNGWLAISNLVLKIAVA